MIPQLPPRWFWLVAALWFVLGIAGAALRTLRLATRETPEGPDVFVLAFIVFAFAVFILPLIAKLDFSDKGASIEFRKDAEQVTDEISQSLRRGISGVATLLGNWLSYQNTIQWQLADPKVAKSKAGYGYAVNMCRSAMKDAASWLFSKDEAWRITLWYQAPEKTGVVFAFGTGWGGTEDSKVELSEEARKAFDGLAFVLSPDDLYVGDAWYKLRVGNFADAPPTSRPPAPGAVTYYGIMFVPVLRDNRRYAVMIIERGLQNRFNDIAEAVASALASFVGSVLSYPLAQYPPS